MRQEILKILTDSTHPMTSGEVFAACKSAADNKQVSDCLGNMLRSGQLARSTNEKGKYVYTTSSAPRQAKQPAAMPAFVKKAKPATSVPAAEGDQPAAPVVEPQRFRVASPPGETPYDTLLDKGLEGPQRFRVALTSDKTLMLFGLAETPLELTREQSAVLAGFVADNLFT